jgi:hypothetical protein
MLQFKAGTLLLGYFMEGLKGARQVSLHNGQAGSLVSVLPWTRICPTAGAKPSYRNTEMRSITNLPIRFLLGLLLFASILCLQREIPDRTTGAAK